MAKVRKSPAKKALKENGQTSIKNKSRRKGKSKSKAGQTIDIELTPQSKSGAARQLSDGEVNILNVFKKYLMTPGQMLCLSNTEIGSMKSSLEKLTESGLLVAEDFKGSYSLTRSGFEAMNELTQK